MLDLTTPRGRIIAASLRLAERRSWRDLTLADIADEAGIALVELSHEFHAKTDILRAFVKAADDEVLRRAPKRNEDQSARDRIFDVVMTRFDVLAPYRVALKKIMWSVPFEPALVPTMLCSQHWMLEAAGIASDGLSGGVRVVGLGSVYARVFRIWLEDDDPGLARTMAALDRRLKRGEQALGRMDDICSAGRRLVCAVLPRGFRRPEERADTPRAADGPTYT
ncbi:MAG: TetR family transcriptional regulator [Hyphomicrobiaceae bacterium]